MCLKAGNIMRTLSIIILLCFKATQLYYLYSKAAQFYYLCFKATHHIICFKGAQTDYLPRLPLNDLCLKAILSYCFCIKLTKYYHVFSMLPSPIICYLRLPCWHISVLRLSNPIISVSRLPSPIHPLVTWLRNLIDFFVE